MPGRLGPRREAGGKQTKGRRRGDDDEDKGGDDDDDGDECEQRKATAINRVSFLRRAKVYVPRIMSAREERK